MSDVVPSPAVRRTWMALGSVLAVAMLFGGTLRVVAVVAHTERHVRTSFAATDVDLVDIVDDEGSVTVVGDQPDDGEIVVTATIQDGLITTEHRESVDGSTLRLTASCHEWLSPFCEVAYTVHVPPALAVRVRADSGRIEVRDVAGDLDLASSNDDVVVEGVRGRAQLVTDNGDVRASALASAEVSARSDNGDVTLGFAVAPHLVDAESDNGDVLVVVPRDETTYVVAASSDNGVARTPVRTDPASADRLRAVSSNGDVTVRYPG